MNLDLTRILESKRKFRQDLASQNIPDKLRMLDALRERALLFHSSPSNNANVQNVRENEPAYPAKQPSAPN